MTENQRTNGNGRLLPYILIFGDIVLVNIVFAVTLLIFPMLLESPRYIREMWVLLEVSLVPSVMVALGRYHEIRAIRMDRELRTALMEVVAFSFMFLSLTTFLHIPAMAGRVYILLFTLAALAVSLFHVIGMSWVKGRRRRGYNYIRTVIVGTGPTATRLVDNMEKDPGFGYRVLAYFDDNPHEEFTGTALPMSELASFVAEKRVRQIYYTLTGHHKALPEVIKIADDNVADFYYVPRIPTTLSRRLELNSIGSMPVLSTMANPLKNPINRAIKRSFDFVVSSVFLVFYPLVYVPVAIAIKMSSPGPVYFKQDRTGYLGKSFKCLKFRTMKVNVNADRAQATEHDPRKTRVGDFLRRTSIDELPQFINVWKGDMSIVGPRPHMLKHTEDYTRLVDRYMVRHAVKPGITGWAQVNGYRGLTDQLWKMERRVEHDVWYIENWTFLLDLKIMARTVINAVKGEKNAF